MSSFGPDAQGVPIRKEGSTAIGRALVAPENMGQLPRLLSLDLSGNGISDRGVVDIALAMEKGLLPTAILRCCDIQADGASCFGRSLRKAITSKSNEDLVINLDIILLICL